MAPDLEAYAGAVSGRALATKCTGGYTSLPTASQQWVGLYRWPIGTDVSQDILRIARPSNWDGLGRVIINRTGILRSGFREISSQSLFRALPPGDELSGIVLPQARRTIDPPTAYPFVTTGTRPTADVLFSGASITLRGYGPDITRPPWTVLATMTLTVGSVMNALVGTYHWVFLQDFSDIDYVSPVSVSLPQGNLRHVSLGGPRQTLPQGDTFDFYGRIEAGVGSILETDTEGNQTELQTINLAVRYDARFEVAQYVTISDATYQIQSIEPVGRQKWQNLTLTRSLAP